MNPGRIDDLRLIESEQKHRALFYVTPPSNQLRLVHLHRSFGAACGGIEDGDQPLIDACLLEFIRECAYWLADYRVLNAAQLVDDERERQEQLVLEGRFAYTCGDVRASDEENAMVLSEELGEVAQEMEEERQRTLDVPHLIEEIVQCMAVAVGWREARAKRAAAAA